ncbi:MAG: winged helix-turn-helix transcriptional regulator, partial [Marinilabiliaceae bacterium]|nr:winged helix-turn-helix transcriptional regulator [Marinilabiliaceae bacterium]
KFDFKGLNPQQVIEHITHFISFLWQIHIFGEGNTRTTAVFLIKYLRKLGFKNINNDLFAQHSWYFRNALVRANYIDISRNIVKTEIYLNRFLANLLFGEKNILKNRELHINFMKNVEVNDTENDTVKSKNDTVKSKDDTVKSKNDTVKSKNDTVKSKNDTVFNLIKENPNITAEEIRIKLNIGIATVKRKIKMLKEKGIITRLGSDKTGSWKIN